MKKVLVFGTFDGIHSGHLYFLKQAKKHGDCLAVVVARDKTVKLIKGRLPKFNEKKRLKNIDALSFVDMTTLGMLRDKYKIIEDIKPNIICLGYDQEAFVEKLEGELMKRKIRCKIKRLKAYKPGKYKSSLLNN